MYTDLCEIITVTKDTQFGSSSQSLPTVTRCRVENTDYVAEGASGNRKRYSRLYFIPSSVIINREDLIRATVVRGVSVTEDYASVEESFHVGGIVAHHIEVRVK
jgi:hypothetical protein